MRSGATSGKSAGDCSPGDRFFCCRHWYDSEVDFEEIVVRGRRGSYVSVEMLSGPEAGETINVVASTLWGTDQIDHARERRERDLQIAAADREHPTDRTSDLAIRALCELVTGDIHVESRATLDAVLAQLGRPTELAELHELAYGGNGPYASVAAPAEAWRLLFEDLARSMPGVVEDRAEETLAGWAWITD